MVRRAGYWPVWTATALALALGASGCLAQADAAVQRWLHGMAAWVTGLAGIAGHSDATPLALFEPLPGSLAWGAALAGVLCLRLPPAPAPSRRATWRGLTWTLLPLVLSILLLVVLQRWLPPLAAAVAVLATVLLHIAWQARDIRRVRGASALCRAMRRGLANDGALPCSLLRLRLSGAPKRLPWREILPSLQARTRRGGDRLARCGPDGAALWLVNTDARAAERVAVELRADLASVLARHDLHCQLGHASQEGAGGNAQALWEAARPG